MRATLTVLAVRLSAEGADLAAQLPAGLAACVAADADPERFGLDEFYRRVARLEGRRCSGERGRRHARAVTTTLQEMAVSVTRLVAGSLPPLWSDLVPASPPRVSRSRPRGRPVGDAGGPDQAERVSVQLRESRWPSRPQAESYEGRRGVVLPPVRPVRRGTGWGGRDGSRRRRT